VIFTSVMAAALLTLLLVLRLMRDGCVERVLRERTQELLAVELLLTAVNLGTQRERIDWGPGSPLRTALGRLDTAARLMEHHPWLEKDRRQAGIRDFTKLMNRLADDIDQLQRGLLAARSDSVLTIQDRVLIAAVKVNLGHFGDLDVPLVDKSTGILTRIRTALGRLAFDLPLALLPLGVIWLFDNVGLDSPENQVPRSALLAAGASFTMFVVCRAIDPTSSGKAKLTRVLLRLLQVWRAPPQDSTPDSDGPTDPETDPNDGPGPVDTDSDRDHQQPTPPPSRRST